jgi:hypothetical protein
MTPFIHGFAGWGISLYFLLAFGVTSPVWSQSRPGVVSVATNRFIISPSSSRAEIQAQLKSMREQEESLHRETRVLQSDIQRIDEGIQQYLSATNSIDDPDILAFKKQMDELEAKHRALHSALAAKLQELPQFRGHFEMKRAAYYRLQQIDKQVSDLKLGQKLLQDRMGVLISPAEQPSVTPSSSTQ